MSSKPSGNPKYEKSKAEMFADIADYLGWDDDERRTQLNWDDAIRLYKFIRGGKTPPDDYTLTDLRRWLVEVSYLITHPEYETAPPDELARYRDYDRAIMPAKHVKLLHETVEDICHERVEAVQDVLDPHQEPEWFDGRC